MAATRRIPEEIAITLSPNEWGQILDGLEVLIEEWDDTRSYHESGVVEFDEIGVPVEIRECEDAEEAAGIASFYRRIRDKLQAQYDAAFRSA